MAKQKRNPRTSTQKPSRDRAADKGPPATGQSDTARNIRETVESIVIAFVLAFLFRTFEAEAFVIPTGSMAPTLRGQHKDVECPMCGFRYQASASVEAEGEPGGFFSQVPGEGRLSAAQDRLPPDLAAPPPLRMRSRLRPRVITGTCPMCRYTMPVDDLPTYNGDRILVNKFIYEFSDPRRWDVVVFKFPGDAKVNYIKRVVGLPNETVLIRNGNIWVRQSEEASFRMARKPPDKVRSMMQIVHDDKYQPKELMARGWPRRWQAVGADGGWQRTEGEGDEKNVRDVFSHDAPNDTMHWIRYHHFVPSWTDWQRMRDGRLSPSDVARIRPRLITDYYAYNTWMTLREGAEPHASKLGLHWVGDLILQCNVNVRKETGALYLDLVKAGEHFECRINLDTGEARLSIRGHDAFERRATEEVLSGAGTYHLTFANVDDRLLLWVDGQRVPFDGDTTYDADQVFGSRQQIVPRSGPSDPGDLSPVGIGARGAHIDVDALRVSRDVYYIADDFGGRNEPITDYNLQRFPNVTAAHSTSLEFLSDPAQWDVFRERQQLQFSLAPGQYFVLGDNSPFSKDGRLWKQDHYGHYVERQLLIGKALFIYWPHSWNRIPGTGIPLPFFPNFQDMGLVR